MHEVRGALAGQCVSIVRICVRVGRGLPVAPVDFGEKSTIRAEFSWERDRHDGW